MPSRRHEFSPLGDAFDWAVLGRDGAPPAPPKDPSAARIASGDGGGFGAEPEIVDLDALGELALADLDADPVPTDGPVGPPVSPRFGDGAPLDLALLSERLTRQVLPKLRLAKTKGYFTLGNLAVAVEALQGSAVHLERVRAFVIDTGMPVREAAGRGRPAVVPRAAMAEARRLFADLLEPLPCPCSALSRTLPPASRRAVPPATASGTQVAHIAPAPAAPTPALPPTTVNRIQQAILARPERERATLAVRFGVDGSAPLTARAAADRLGVGVTRLRLIEGDIINALPAGFLRRAVREYLKARERRANAGIAEAGAATLPPMERSRTADRPPAVAPDPALPAAVADPPPVPGIAGRTRPPLPPGIWAEVEGAMARLSVDRRRILAARLGSGGIGGVSRREVAAQLGVPAYAVRHAESELSAALPSLPLYKIVREVLDAVDDRKPAAPSGGHPAVSVPTPPPGSEPVPSREPAPRMDLATEVEVRQALRAFSGVSRDVLEARLGFGERHSAGQAADRFGVGVGFVGRIEGHFLRRLSPDVAWICGQRFAGVFDLAPAPPLTPGTATDSTSPVAGELDAASGAPEPVGVPRAGDDLIGQGGVGAGESVAAPGASRVPFDPVPESPRHATEAAPAEGDPVGGRAWLGGVDTAGALDASLPDVSAAMIEAAIKALPAHQRAILRARFGLDGLGALSARDAADRLGVSVTYFRLMESRVVDAVSTGPPRRALREHLRARELRATAAPRTDALESRPETAVSLPNGPSDPVPRATPVAPPLPLQPGREGAAREASPTIGTFDDSAETGLAPASAAVPVIEQVIAAWPAHQQAILRARFGLDGSARATAQRVAWRFGVRVVEVWVLEAAVLRDLPDGPIRRAAKRRLDPSEPRPSAPAAASSSRPGLLSPSGPGSPVPGRTFDASQADRRAFPPPPPLARRARSTADLRPVDPRPTGTPDPKKVTSGPAVVHPDGPSGDPAEDAGGAAPLAAAVPLSPATWFVVESAIAALPPDQRRILRARFGPDGSGGLTTRDAIAQFGVRLHAVRYAEADLDTALPLTARDPVRRLLDAIDHLTAPATPVPAGPPAVETPIEPAATPAFIAEPPPPAVDGASAVPNPAPPLPPWSSETDAEVRRALAAFKGLPREYLEARLGLIDRQRAGDAANRFGIGVDFARRIEAHFLGRLPPDAARLCAARFAGLVETDPVPPPEPALPRDRETPAGGPAEAAPVAAVPEPGANPGSAPPTRGARATEDSDAGVPTGHGGGIAVPATAEEDARIAGDGDCARDTVDAAHQQRPPDALVAFETDLPPPEQPPPARVPHPNPDLLPVTPGLVAAARGGVRLLGRLVGRARHQGLSDGHRVGGGDGVGDRTAAATVSGGSGRSSAPVVAEDAPSRPSRPPERDVAPTEPAAETVDVLPRAALVAILHRLDGKELEIVDALHGPLSALPGSIPAAAACCGVPEARVRVTDARVRALIAEPKGPRGR